LSKKDTLVKEFTIQVERHIRVIEHPHADGSITWSVELADGTRKPFQKTWFNDITPALSLAERMRDES
jgi:hypothetical protein